MALTFDLLLILSQNLTLAIFTNTSCIFQKLEEETQRANTEKEAIMEQQASTVKRVLDSNLELSDE